MNENQIETFLTVVRYGTFSRAAELLFLTQPTVTHRIQALEEELGAQLFHRAPGAAQLTVAGSAFLPQAEQLWQAFTVTHRIMRPYADRQRALVIGFPALMVQGSFIAYRKIMTLAAADTALRAQILDSPQAGREALLSGDVDLLFADLSLPEFTGEEFARCLLFRGGAYACMHRAHRLARRGGLTLADLRGEALIGYSDSTFFSQRMREQLAQAGIPYAPGGPLPEEAARQLRPDGGIMLVNVRLTQEDWLVYLPLELPQEQPVGLVWLAERHSDALLRVTSYIAALPESIWRK